MLKRQIRKEFKNRITVIKVISIKRKCDNYKVIINTYAFGLVTMYVNKTMAKECGVREAVQCSIREWCFPENIER